MSTQHKDTQKQRENRQLLKIAEHKVLIKILILVEQMMPQRFTGLTAFAIIKPQLSSERRFFHL